MLGRARFHCPVPQAPQTPLGDVSRALAIDLPIDDDWKREVTEKLKAMGHDQYTLATHIGCSQSNVSQTLSIEGKRAQKTSTFAHAISLAVGVPLTTPAVAALAAHGALEAGDPNFRSIIEGLARTYGVRLANES